MVFDPLPSVPPFLRCKSVSSVSSVPSVWSVFWVPVIALAALVVVSGAAQQARRASEGVFTAAQAERGHVVFERVCAGCHASDLHGDEPREVPALVHEQFDMSWRGEPVAALHRKVRTTMPADRPGTLSSAEYTDIVAYILQTNGFRPGAGELTADQAALDAITIDPLERTP